MAKKKKAAAKKLELDLKSRLKRAAAVGQLLPFTIRLTKPYEAGPGDDALELTFDPSAVPWPLDGTQPPAAPSSSNLTGAISYYWDFGADTTGYATLGTVETLVGSNVSMTATGFPIATALGTCSTVQSIEATAVSLTSAGLRFGTVNPFNNEVAGTVALRPSIRTKITKCDGSTSEGVYTTSTADPPFPVSFRGKFTVSPGVSANGTIRFGVLRILDSADVPQRSNFGLVHVCTDPAAADCAPMAFPVRAKLLSMTADVLLGDQMPPPPPAP